MTREKDMDDPRPQQLLLLELLIMSGDIAVADGIEGSILERTVNECERRGWITLRQFGAGFRQASITEKGRILAKSLMPT